MSPRRPPITTTSKLHGRELEDGLGWASKQEESFCPLCLDATDTGKRIAGGKTKANLAVKAVNQVLGSLRLEKHPEKTFIGRMERGFDFLGYHLSPEGLAVAEKTIEKFLVCAGPALRAGAGRALRLPLAWIVRAAVGKRWLCGGVLPRGYGAVVTEREGYPYPL